MRHYWFCPVSLDQPIQISEMRVACPASEELNQFRQVLSSVHPRLLPQFKSHLLLSDRSDKDNVNYNSNSKKITSNARLSRELAKLIHYNAFLLSIEDLDKLVDKLEKYDSIESMPDDLQDKIKLARKYYNSLKDYPNLLAFNSFIKNMMPEDDGTSPRDHASEVCGHTELELNLSSGQLILFDETDYALSHCAQSFFHLVLRPADLRVHINRVMDTWQVANWSHQQRTWLELCRTWSNNDWSIILLLEEL